MCDTYGCLGSTALPEQKLADFFTNTIRTFLTYILPDFFHTITSIFTWEKRDNNRHLLNSSFTHIFHPVGFPLTAKSFLEIFLSKVPDEVKRTVFRENQLELA